MEAESNYWFIWLIYLGASGLFFGLLWWVTSLGKANWLVFALRGFMVAIVLTPWYANPAGDSLAPALMIVVLDAITIGVDSASRALVPLILAVIASQISATILYFIIRKKRRINN